jgi:hypothetical protein
MRRHARIVHRSRMRLENLERRLRSQPPTGWPKHLRLAWKLRRRTACCICCTLHRPCSTVQHAARTRVTLATTTLIFLDFSEKGGCLALLHGRSRVQQTQSPVSARPRHVVQPLAPAPEVDARPSVTRNRTNGAQIAVKGRRLRLKSAFDHFRPLRQGGAGARR